MNIYVQRLRALARACREAQSFDMSCFIKDDCGTPGCALGNYAARTDLQNEFAMVRMTSAYSCDRQLNLPFLITHLPTGDVAIAGTAVAVQEHFGLHPEEELELFDTDGCGDARRDNLAAAAYVEAFIARKYPATLLAETLAAAPQVEREDA